MIKLIFVFFLQFKAGRIYCDVSRLIAILLALCDIIIYDFVEKRFSMNELNLLTITNDYNSLTIKYNELLFITLAILISNT